jgi:ATP-dependent Lhr-like helicase
VTRGAVLSERTTGGFAAAYQVLSAFEEAGRVRRGYFVAGLGAAQFATPGAVDRLRSYSADPTDSSSGRARDAEPGAVLLAAIDPANPFGAALPWPAPDPNHRGHRPGRKAGALVVLVDGELGLYVERGGRTLLTFTDDPASIQRAVDAMALAVRDGVLGKLTVERADGEDIHRSPLSAALEVAGFHVTPRGLRLRQ